MRKLLTLLALAGLSAAVACGDDSGSEDESTGDKDSTNNNKTDGGAKDSTVPPRDQQIDSDSLGAACTKDTDCKGAGSLTCVTNLGMMFELEGGYCTAQCTADSECGANGACPVAGLAQIPVIGPIIASAGIIPSNCFKTCDPKVANSCGREGFECRSLLDGLASNPQAAPFITQLQAFPGLDKPYCVPPLPEIDGGFPFPLPDAGFSFLPLQVSGLDAGL